MKLGKVIGKVWADRKVGSLRGCRMHILQPLTGELRNTGKALVAADPKNIAGDGDIVVYVTNTDAAMAFDTGFAPVNASIIELVDSID